MSTTAAIERRDRNRSALRAIRQDAAEAAAADLAGMTAGLVTGENVRLFSSALRKHEALDLWKKYAEEKGQENKKACSAWRYLSDRNAGERLQILALAGIIQKIASDTNNDKNTPAAIATAAAIVAAVEFWKAIKHPAAPFAQAVLNERSAREKREAKQRTQAQTVQVMLADIRAWREQGYDWQQVALMINAVTKGRFAVNVARLPQLVEEAEKRDAALAITPHKVKWDGMENARRDHQPANAV